MMTKSPEELTYRVLRVFEEDDVPLVLHERASYSEAIALCSGPDSSSSNARSDSALFRTRVKGPWSHRMIPNNRGRMMRKGALLRP